jgi:hypothetical protein
VPYGHAATKLETAFDGQAKRRGMRPGDAIQPLQVNRVVDVLVFVDFFGHDPVRSGISSRQSKKRIAQ